MNTASERATIDRWRNSYEQERDPNVNRELTKTLALIYLVCCIFGAQTINVFANELEPGQITPYPYQDNPSYKPHELRFEVPNDGIARAEYESEEFYAILLKSAARCTLEERGRADVQSLFPKNKVFMDRFNCDDSFEEVISYSNVNLEYSFIAVYAGKTHEAAQQLMDEYDLAARFPGANIRQMRAVLNFP